jgi:signal peptidase II
VSGDEISHRAPGPRRSRLKIAALLVIVVVLALDLATKAWMQDLLQMDPSRNVGGRRIEIVEGFFALEGTYNAGVTFGLAGGKTIPILVFTILVMLLLGAWLFSTSQRSAPLHVGIGMVLGGALGNLWDRVHWAKVRDFLLFYWGDPKDPSFSWPNFNVADSMIVCGVILIVWDEIFGRMRREKRAAAATGVA